MKHAMFFGIAVLGIAVLLTGVFFTIGQGADTVQSVQAYSFRQAGWGVQVWNQEDESDLPFGPQYWVGFAAEAFHYSPRGSFYEVADEDITMKFTVTVEVTSDVVDHPIPIDSAVQTRIFVDGDQRYTTGINSHEIVEISFDEGIHVVDIIVEGGVNWTMISVGDCLWGTDSRILYMNAGD